MTQGRLVAGRPLIETFVAPLEAYALATAAGGRQRILEVGSAYGFSTIVMAQAAPAAEILSVDPHTGYQSWDTFNRNLDRYGVAGRVRCLRKPSQEVLPTLPAGRFDMMFVDGDHGEGPADHDVAHALRLVRAGGIIAVHDYTERWQGVKDAVDRRLRGLPAWRIQTLYLAVNP